MKQNLLKTAAVLLIVITVAPATFLSAPRPAHALLGAAGIVNVASDFSATSLLDLAKNTVTSIASVTTKIATVAQQIDTYVLEPLAFVVSGNLLKSITAGVLDFVTGGTNGTGRPQFVTDLRGHMQGVGDVQTLAFLVEFGNNSNSPFASSIISALNTDYLQQTSLGGFFAANQCTLTQYSPNINAYLAGDWSQGGTAAWFALTTRDQNNPFLMHVRAQSELGQLTSDATAARLAELNWGQGFLSWCGADSSVTGGAVDANGQPQQINITAQPRTAGQVSTGQTAGVGGSYNYNINAGNAPGDPCTNADGTPGTIKTPGSVIAAGLNKALGLNWDKVANFGNQVGPQINTIMKNIGQVMQTVNLATSLFGANDSGGLAGVGSTGSAARAALQNMQTSQGYLGATQTSVTQNAASQSTFSVTSFLNSITQYETAWNSIRSAANAANTALSQTASICSASGNTAQATTATSVQSTQVTPLLAQSQQAASNIAAARNQATLVQSDITSGSSSYSSDLQTLQSMPPTSSDITDAQQQAQSLGSASSTPPGSLNVMGSTAVDRLNLLTQNANAITAAGCP